MKINHNMSAMIANNQLLINENGLSAAIERLSSGLKINHASDDAAGMAISTKMRAQIKGLDQASRNASDGISVLNTADGALTEVTNMLQRMRELSVQAANGTNTKDDKDAIQQEIASLTEEIDRISTDTEFNKKKLLDGSLDQRVYPDSRAIQRIDISDSVGVGNYKISVDQDARQAIMVGGEVSTGDIPAGVVAINGVEVEITEGQTLEDVYENLRKAAEEGEVNLMATTYPGTLQGYGDTAGYSPSKFESGAYLVFVSERYGSGAEIKITCDNDELADFLGLPMTGNVKGMDAKVSLDKGFTSQSSCSCDGNKVTITDRNGFEISFMVGAELEDEEFIDAKAENMTDPDKIYSATVTQGQPLKVNLNVTDIGTMTLQIGANEGQTMDIRIPEVSSKSLYIDKVDVSTVTGADRAITIYDEALSKVSEVRSRIGAFQNRLEHTVASLDGTEENVTAALSRVEDADMAEEMTTYTQYNVLSQAATSVLAQANDIPQQALQLLQ